MWYAVHRHNPHRRQHSEQQCAGGEIVPGREALRLWGDTHKLRISTDKSPIDIAIDRSEVEAYGASDKHKAELTHSEAVGYGSPVIRSDGAMYAPSTTSYRRVDDPHPTFFVFMQVEEYLKHDEHMRALAWSLYVYDKPLKDFVPSREGARTRASLRTVERMHKRLREDIHRLLVNSYDPSISEAAANAAIKELRKKSRKPKKRVV